MRCPGTGPGGSRYTVMVSGAVAGAAAELKEKIRRDRVGQARGGGGRISSSATAAWGSIGVPQKQLSLGEIAMTAYMFRLDLPARHGAAGSRRSRPTTTR